jgi:thiamine pyrophosphokinase
MIAYLIIGNNIDLSLFPFEKKSILIGVDRGAYLAVNSGLKLDVACGDFDSVNAKELALIKQHSKKIVILNSIKDITDAKQALIYAKAADKVVILGGIQGDRIEHFLAMLNMVREDPRIIIQDENSVISRIDAALEPYDVQKNAYRFISFFALEDAVISLKGFQYPLNQYPLAVSDSLCISNQLRNQKATIRISQGKVLMVRSKDDARV